VVGSHVYPIGLVDPPAYPSSGHTFSQRLAAVVFAGGELVCRSMCALSRYRDSDMMDGNGYSGN